MTYPFKDNPLDDYLIELRKCREEVYAAFRILRQGDIPHKIHTKWTKKYRIIQSRIKNIMERIKYHHVLMTVTQEKSILRSRDLKKSFLCQKNRPNASINEVPCV